MWTKSGRRRVEDRDQWKVEQVSLALFFVRSHNRFYDSSPVASLCTEIIAAVLSNLFKMAAFRKLHVFFYFHHNENREEGIKQTKHSSSLRWYIENFCPRKLFRICNRFQMVAV